MFNFRSSQKSSCVVAIDLKPSTFVVNSYVSRVLELHNFILVDTGNSGGVECSLVLVRAKWNHVSGHQRLDSFFIQL